MTTSTDSKLSNGGPFVPGLAIRGVLLLGLVLVALLSLLPTRPPAPLGPEAPADAFSAARAFEHVEALATEPHPVGTEAHERVRAELIRRIEALGLGARVHEAVAARAWGSDRLRAAWVHNVVTRLEGSAGGDDAVLLMAHYDSAPAGPGAADDAAGVAAILETLRALQAEGELPHDVIALFTDAEERGLLGAEAFLHSHPWADDVRLVLNFEARGASGPSIMFETGPGSGALMYRYARVDPEPLAASYSYDVYRYLPNDTDFTLFKERGLPGFNFAFIHDAGRYHTALDTPANLSKASLQHHGTHALALTRHFAAAEDLGDLPRGGPAAYFALPWIGLVVYPASYSLVFIALLGLAAIVLWLVGLRRGRVSAGGTLLYGALALVAAVLAAALTALLHLGLSGPLDLAPGRLATPGTYLLGLALVAAALTLLPLVGLRRGERGDPVAGVSFAWVVLALATGIGLPSTSYLMLWPMAGLLLVLALQVLRRRPPSPAIWALVLIVAAMPALWLWLPTLGLIGAAFGAAGVGPIVTALLAALLTTLLTPQLIALGGDGRRRLRLAAIPFALGLVAVATAVFTAGYTPDRPQSTHVLYALDADEESARWATLENRPSDWTRRLVGESKERASLVPFVSEGWPEMISAPAPVSSQPAPQVELRARESVAEDRHHVRLDLKPAPERLLLRLHLRSASPLVGLRLADRQLEIEDRGADGNFTLEVIGVPGQGLPLQVELDDDAPLEVDAVSHLRGLPEGPGFPSAPRPDTLMPSAFAATDLRMVRKQYVFETTPPPTSQDDQDDGGST